MNCAEARSYAPLFSLPVPGEFSTEMEAARRHMEGCSECRAILLIESAEDDILSRRMRDVPIPVDYSADLLRQFVTIRLATQGASPAASRRRKWLLTLASLAFVGLCCVLLLRSTFTPATFELSKLLALLDASQASPEWPVASRADRPYGWSRVSGLASAPSQRLPKAPIPIDVVPFEYQPRRAAKAASGRLWIVDAECLSDAQSIPSLGGAEIWYGVTQARLAWTENGVVYLLESDAETVRRLWDALLNSRSFA
jgi:hypothetical protein